MRNSVEALKSNMDFQRPKEEFIFSFGGMSLRDRPDQIGPTKYPLAINVRGYASKEIRTRPGWAKQFVTGATNGPVTDMRAFATLQTFDAPRILTRNVDDTIWLDTGVQVGSMTLAGYSGGASLIPFRPNESPQPWMYIANGNDYQKFSAPNSLNAVTQQKVGIAEPQLQPEAIPVPTGVNAGLNLVSMYVSHGNPTLTQGGTAGATSSGARISDTVVASFQDPNATTLGTIFSGEPFPMTLQVGSAVAYSRYMFVEVGGTNTQVVDVFPPFIGSITIQSIYYFIGTAGRCIIVPNAPAEPEEGSIYGVSFLSGIRRGALIKVGTEVCYVLSVTFGPDNSIAIETSTVNPHTVLDALTGVPAISVYLSNGNYATQAITSPFDAFAVTAGVGTVSGTPLFNFVNSGAGFQKEDYLHLSVKIDVLTNLTELRFLIDVGDGSFTQNFYYYTIRAADLAQVIANTVTQLAGTASVIQKAAIDEEEAIMANNEGITFSGAQSATGASQWTEIFFPISQLTRVGNDETRSLQTMTKFQLLVNCSGALNVGLGGVFITGGYQPDVGDVGAPLLYRFRGRSSVTGVRSNPSPETRYGVNPRRTGVAVIIPFGLVPYDTQIDTWDVFRYGGSVTQWRYIGSVPLQNVSGNAVFYDNYDDAAATAGEALDFDNFEPWPSVDVPNTGNVIKSSGTAVVVNSTDSDITQYLPGTQITFGGTNVFTFRKRPTPITGTQYLLELVECASSAPSPYLIQEPLIARVFLPYMWGPDASGTVFAVGDQFRPGTCYFTKNNNPDAAPDKYNVEITNPSEPLIGGEIVDGLSYVGSPKRWWALYPQPDNPVQRYNFVELPFTRGLAAPFGHCTDGKRVFYWAKDGIYANDQSLTDADLYQLFPHEGVAGKSYTYQNYTVPAPDYSQAAKFRLAYSNGYLYATYVVQAGVQGPVLVCDLRTGAWSVDIYTGAASCFYSSEQQSASGPSGISVANPSLYVAHFIDNVHAQSSVSKQKDLSNDETTPITCALATFEFDGGDIRAPKQWGDVFIDMQLASAGNGIVPSFNPASLSNPIGTALTVTQAAISRTRLPYNVGGLVVSDFIGLYMQWSDDYTAQMFPTTLYAWQPSFVVQPARDIGFITLGSSFGLKGFAHIRQLLVAYISTAPVTITIVTFDGQDPPNIVLPSTGGLYQKITFPVGPNKGTLFQFQTASTAPFQIFEDDCEVWIGEWGRSDNYSVFRNLGGRPIDAGPI